MANTIKLRRSATAGAVPTTSNLALGELAMNTADGKLFMKTDDGAGTVEIAEIGAGGSITISSSPPADPDAGDIYWDQDDGSAYIYYIDADSTAQWVPLTPLADTPVPGSNAYKIDDISSSFNGVLTDFTINVDGSAHEPAYINATLISLGGVIQQPTTAYTISGSTISFASAPSSGVDFFGIDLAAALPIGTPNDGTVTPAKLSTGGPYWNVSGGVGIGTTSVSTKLHIVSNGSGGDVWVANGSGQNCLLEMAGNGNTPQTNSALYGQDASNNVYAGWARGAHPVLLGTNNTERARIDSSGRVLIGTTTEGQSPSGETLTVANNGHCGITVRSSSTTTGNLFFSDGTSGTDEYAGAIVYDHASNALNLYTNGGQERMRIDASGKVGIGTSSPSSFNSDGNNLVVGSGSGGQGMSIYSGTSSYGTIYFADGTSGDALYRGSILYNHASDFMRFDTAASERMRIDSSGRLGIGTTSPGSRLQVSEQNAGSDTSITIQNSQNSDANATVKIKALQYVRNGGEIVFGRENGFDWSTTTSCDGYIAFAPVLNNTNSEAMRIDSSGNVGIGTTSPTVISAGNTNLTLGPGSSGNQGSEIHMESASHYGSNNGSNISYIGSDLYVVNREAGNLSFYTSLTERMRIDSSGRLLVGTTSARTDFFGSLSANVQVEGTSFSAYSCYATNGNGAFIFGRSNAISGSNLGILSWQADDGTDEVEAASISATVDGTPGANDMPGRLVFSTTADGASSPTERVRIDSSGNVGIGTASTSTGKLAIINTSALNELEFKGNDYTNIYSETTSGFDIGINSTSSAYLRFLTNNTERVRIDSSGRLLVGTSTDTAARLVVKGSAGSGDDGINVISGSTTVGSKAAIFFSPSTSGSFSTGSAIKTERLSPDGSDLQFYTCTALGNSPTERMRIHSGGEVSIGTTNTNPAGNNVNGTTISSGGRISAQVSGDHHRLGRAQDGTIVSFHSAGGIEGSISISGSTTSYNTSSDYRLKENVVSLTGAADRVNQLQVRRFNFIADPNTTVDGFLAHEAQAVVPECVTGTKDEVDDEGNPVYQGIDQSKLVPLLTAALQEALAEIESLKARVTALEAQ